MSRYDDDYDDNEDEREDDDLEDNEDDDDGVRRSTSNPNPFSSRPNSVRGAGLPQQRPPVSPGGSVPSPIRTPGGPGSSQPFGGNRPNSPTPGGGSSGGVQPFQRSPLSPRDDKKDDSDNTKDAVNRVLGSFGQKLTAGDNDKRDDAKPPSGGSGGLFGSRGNNDDKKDEKPTHSSFGSRIGGGGNNSSSGGDKSDSVGGLTRGLGGLTSRLGGSDDKKDDAKPPPSSGGGLGGFGSRLGGGNNDKKDEKSPSGGGLGGFGSRIGGGNNNEKRDDAKPPSGGGLGGLTSRIGSGNNNDKKEEKPPSGGGLGGFGSRIGGGLGGGSDKKDDKSSGAGGLGGLTSRIGGGLGGGDRKDDKPASGGALGGLTSRFGGNNNDKKDNKPLGGGIGGGMGGARPGSGTPPKDDKPAGGKLGGALGGLTSRFGGDKKDEPKAPPSTGSGAFGSTRPGGTSMGQSPLGGTLSSGSKPPTSTGASKSPFGGAAAGKPGAPKGATPSFGERLKGLNPFAPKKDTRQPARARASKAPKVDQGGLSLDHKLDILGVSLLLGSLVLLLSSLSPTKGALTEAVNHDISYAFGWGAVCVLMVLFAIGLWLILRHFGEEAPVISRTRLIGIGMLFIGVLVLAQFVYSFNYHVGSDQDYLDTLKNVFLPITYDLGRGGGWVGGQIYFLLLSNFGEIGAFMVTLGWLLVGVMLGLSVSASDLAMIIVSNARNISDVMRQRRQRAAAVRAEKQQALALAAQPLSVSKVIETTPPLAAPASPALPATVTAEEQRRIPITTGGRTSSVPFRQLELTDVPAAGTSVPAASLNGTTIPTPDAIPVAVPEEKSGGLFSRVRTALPGAKSPDGAIVEKQPVPLDQPVPADKAAGGLRGRLFGGIGGRDKDAVTPAAPAAASTAIPQTTSSVAAPSTLTPQPQMQAAPTVGQSVTPPTAPAAAPIDPNTVQPAAQPSPTTTPLTPAGAPPTAAAPSTPAAPPRLRDLLGRSPTPPAPNAQTPAPAASTPASPVTPANGSPNGAATNGTSSSGVLPFQRIPLTRPEAPAANLNGNGSATPTASPTQSAPTTPSASPMPDLQSRMRALRDNAEPNVAPPLVSTPPTMPPPTRPAPSPALGRPDDIPFSVPQATTQKSSLPIEVPQAPTFRSRPPRQWKMADPAALLASGVDEEPDHEMLLKRAHIIEETLSSFGAPGRVVDVRTGPVVTQFGVEPDYVPGRGGKKNRVKVGAIAALDKDLQLALGAKAIRIEAPVPGKGYVGVEVPNEKAEVVHLRNVLESAEFRKVAGKSPLAIALGQGVDGTPVAGDLASMPHLLIAGTTGSGKSVCVNAIIASILLNNTPKQVKFVMVDPKRVELTQYNGIPHLIAPVVVELERIVSVLKWVTREMDERYRKFSNAASRNIEDYNKHLPSTEEPMPYIVVIIDELADLMMLAPDDTERVITRIAALARATGIHLVIATQRPSVDVVTGLIKANFPARIAFAVAGNTDSRVILDQPGAERLLGRGDMLYMSGDSPAPVRLQGVFVSDNEIGNITRFWRGQMSEEDLIMASRPIGASIDDGNRSEGGVIIRGNSNSSANGNTTRTTQTQVAFWDNDQEDEDADEDDGVADGEDEMYEQAVELVRRLNKASVSLLQRRLRIGYTRAARMIDTMEARGVVGPATEGSKPREVLPVR
ncbi:MAG TPA: DNA translocase FtsK [Phototrophicaceae bacterium]|nr:DNA translocase FtsK [Phototrophicaceae bacterium]